MRLKSHRWNDVPWEGQSILSVKNKPSDWLSTCALSKSVQILTSVVDPDSYDPYVFGLQGCGSVIIFSDTDPDLLIIKQRSKKNLGFYCFVTWLWHFIFEEWCKCTVFLKSKKHKTYFLLTSWKLLMKRAGFRTVTQWYGYPDPYKMSRIHSTDFNIF